MWQTVGWTMEKQSLSFKAGKWEIYFVILWMADQ